MIHWGGTRSSQWQDKEEVRLSEARGEVRTTLCRLCRLPSETKLPQPGQLTLAASPTAAMSTSDYSTSARSWTKDSFSGTSSSTLNWVFCAWQKHSRNQITFLILMSLYHLGLFTSVSPALPVKEEVLQQFSSRIGGSCLSLSQHTPNLNQWFYKWLDQHQLL